MIRCIVSKHSDQLLLERIDPEPCACPSASMRLHEHESSCTCFIISNVNYSSIQAEPWIIESNLKLSTSWMYLLSIDLSVQKWLLAHQACICRPAICIWDPPMLWAYQNQSSIIRGLALITLHVFNGGALDSYFKAIAVFIFKHIVFNCNPMLSCFESRI